MVNVSAANLATWSVAAAAVGGVITRPRNWPEAWWAVAGAVVLVASSLLPVRDAVVAVGKGTDVYLFLVGMMLLAELARRGGLFDWLASYALQHAKGSGTRLFLLIYAVGTLVTVFLSNDATAVVLTPAVYAVTRTAKVPAIPYLLICALVANAASFVLPISNPANLVVFGDHMPTLGAWCAEFGAASVVAIVVTYALLRLTQRRGLPAQIPPAPPQQPLSVAGRTAAASIAVTAGVLLVASVRGWQLGLPTCAAGVAAWLITALVQRRAPWPVLRDVSWGVLPLVAGLFVLVEAVDRTGLSAELTRLVATHARQSPAVTAWITGGAVAVASNLINNLPMGLITAGVTQGAALHPSVTGAMLIGVDLGPNLSVTGSLATILWLVALRREGEDMSARAFLAVGAVVMPLSLVATLAAFIG